MAPESKRALRLSMRAMRSSTLVAWWRGARGVHCLKRRDLFKRRDLLFLILQNFVGPSPKNSKHQKNGGATANTSCGREATLDISA
jgi:hypothetical protein